MSRGEGGGAPEGNSNAEKHSLFSAPDKLLSRLSDDEKEIFWAVVEDLFERIEGDVGPYERETVKDLAIDTIKRRRFNEYDGAFNPEKQNVHEAYSRIRRDNIKELKEMGISTKSPDAKEAESKQEWFSKIAEAEEQADDE